MQKTEEYLSQIKYAEHRNVTKGYIGRSVKEGRLHLTKGKLNVKCLMQNWIINRMLIRLPIIGVKKHYMKKQSGNLRQSKGMKKHNTTG